MQEENRKLYNLLMETEKDYQAELEGKESISNNRPTMEWYEDRYQQDCIKINQLNTTIDVLVHKIEKLRQIAGLE